MMRERRRRYIIPYSIAESDPEIYDIVAFNSLDAIQKMGFEFLESNKEEENDALENKLYSMNFQETIDFLNENFISVGNPYLIEERGLK